MKQGHGNINNIYTKYAVFYMGLRYCDDQQSIDKVGRENGAFIRISTTNYCGNRPRKPLYTKLRSFWVSELASPVPVQ